jgi:predicted Zn-dependent protease
MWTRYGPWVVLTALLLGGGAVWLGEIDDSSSLSSAMEVWGDVLRDVDQFGLSLTRVSDQREMQLGRELASYWSSEVGDRTEWTPYVTAVGQSLTPHLRRQGIQYEFHVVQSPWVNAFALPGGQIFITTEMLAFLQSEAELAAILGHEMAHVDQRHCIEQFQAQIALEHLGIEQAAKLAETPRQLLAAGYRKYQELEADAAGLRLAVAAGYDPEAVVLPFERLRRRFEEAELSTYQEPVSEVGGSLATALGSYFETHPPTAERISRLRQLIAQQRPWRETTKYYVGAENYRRRIARSQQKFEE